MPRAGALRIFLAVTGALTLCHGARDAQANGRFPGAGQVVLDRADRERLAVRTTFGLLVSTEGGRRPRWICEDAAFFGSGAYDPPVAIAPDGAILAALVGGVSRGTAGGCAWETAKGATEGRWTVDLSVDADGRVIGVALGAGGRGLFVASTDAGRSFRSVDLPEDAAPLTIDAAPSRPRRVYVSARAAFPQFGTMLVSDDGGDTWTSNVFDLKGGREPYIAAVDPKDPDRLFLRVFADTEERVLRSDDGGKTFASVHATTSFLFGLALSPDGARIAVGTPAEGLRIAPVGAGPGAPLALSPLAAVDARCLAWDRQASGERLFACGNQPADPFTLARFDGAAGAPTPLFRLADVEPLDCPTSTRTGALCPAAWPAVAAQLGRDAGAPPPPAADAGVAPSPTDAGSPTSETPLRTGGGCDGCGIVRPERPSNLWTSLGILGLVAGAWSRRRRSVQAAVYATKKDCY